VPPRHLLVVPYFYPPFPGSGNRWPTLARYLREAGHRVTVLATPLYGRLDDDQLQGVVRVHDLRSTRILRRALRRGDPPTVSAAVVTPPPGVLLERVFVPDAHAVGWMPAALAAARRVLAEGTVDALITSSPPESTHLIGLLLGRRRPAWIADFRDGWCFEPLRPPFPLAGQRALDRWLERRVARTAEVAVGATRPIAADLEARLGARAAYVPNGWDPALAELPGTAPETCAGETLLVMTGTFSGVRSRDPRPLLRALAAARSQPHALRLRLVLAGERSAVDHRLIEDCGAADAVTHVGILPRSDALALQRSADALVLLTSHNTSEATGKLFEYIGAGRPVLALAEGNEAERIVRETNIGVAVAPDDVDAIVQALRRVAAGELARAYAPRNIEQYTYPVPARAMAELIEEAITLRRRRDT
jgi:glycosyltransferase involved in cell wall biosynthesis